MTSYVRPEQRLLPSPSPESVTLWTGGLDGQLMIHRCRSCRRFFHPPGPVCWRCHGLEVGPEPVSGRATVAAFTINRQPWLPGFPPPYVVAMVELADEPDVRLITNIVDIAPEDVRTGLDVEVFFEEWEGSDGKLALPLFRPVGGKP